MTRLIITCLFLYILSFLINWYKLPEYLFFSHEQGRDAYTARGIVTGRHLTLIGPKTEISGLFTPPWYYYILGIPYALGSGNPLIASFFSVLFASSLAPIIFLLTRNLLKSNHWGLVAALFSAFSFEFISYARWLTNVSPALTLSALSFYFLWLYHLHKKSVSLLRFVVLAILASQLQIVLIFQFLFVYLVCLIWHQIPKPSPRSFLAILAFGLILFSPLVLFDFRHDHISTKAIIDFLTGATDYRLQFDLFGAFHLYYLEILTIFKRTVFNFNNPLILSIFLSLIVAGLWQFAKNSQNRQVLIFTLTITFMGLGIFIFNIGLTQLYPTTGIGLVLLFTLAIRSLWITPHLRILAVILSIFWLASFVRNLFFIDQNRGMFFTTIAEGLNYRDQKAVLNFIRNDAAGQEYRIEAFTLPYLKPQGWQYLHEYFFDEADNKTAKLVYIVIEKNVESFWQQKWIEELGPSQFISERNFGEIKVQKRQLN